MPVSKPSKEKTERSQATLARLFREQFRMDPNDINNATRRAQLTKLVRAKLKSKTLRSKKRAIYEQFLEILTSPDSISDQLAEVNHLVRELLIIVLRDRRRIRQMKISVLKQQASAQPTAQLPPEITGKLAELQTALEGASEVDQLDATVLAGLDAEIEHLCEESGLSEDYAMKLIRTYIEGMRGLLPFLSGDQVADGDKPVDIPLLKKDIESLKQGLQATLATLPTS